MSEKGTLSQRTAAQLRRQAALLDLSDDAVLVWQLDGPLEYWNAGAERLYGYTVPEAIGQISHSLLRTEFPDSQAATLAELRRAQRWQGELIHTTRAGRRITVNAVMVLNRQDEHPTVLEINRDITEARKAEQFLRESEERLRLALQAASQGLYDLNLQTGEALVTPEYATMLGYDPATFRETNTRWVERLHPDDREKVAGVYRDYVAGKIPDYSVEFRQRTRAGDWKWILSIGRIVARDHQGRPLRMLGTHTDITARKQAEEEVIRLNASLEQRVAERTAQLEAANQELEAFSYSVSHDLRAPLRAMHGYISYIEEDYASRLDAEGNRLLSVVRSEARRMGQLIEDLLAFSRLGRQDMNWMPVDMLELARQAFEDLTSTSKSARPRLELSPLSPTTGDLAMLRQVFTNLISNAIKFSSHEPSPVVEIGCRDQDQHCVYYVKDNGVGFDEKYGSKLFGVFQRLHREEDFPGTGVGLALVQRVIRRHGGRVWAESKLGQGATFYFTLPKVVNP